MTEKMTLLATGVAAAVVLTLMMLVGPQAQGTDEPGLAEQSQPVSLLPGNVMEPSQVRFIEKPGEYGLGSDLRGSRYAIVEGHLVRLDRETLEVQSILRADAEN